MGRLTERGNAVTMNLHLRCETTGLMSVSLETTAHVGDEGGSHAFRLL